MLTPTPRQHRPEVFTPVFSSFMPGHVGGSTSARPLAGGATDSDKECRRALVVDDAPDVTEMLAMLMRFIGYEVATAFSAPEALEAARGGRFHVVVSDIGMPGMNGYDLAQALRRMPEYEGVPLIAVTGFAMYEDRERALQSGFDAFLTKPINPTDLMDLVKRLCA